MARASSGEGLGGESPPAYHTAAEQPRTGRCATATRTTTRREDRAASNTEAADQQGVAEMQAELAADVLGAVAGEKAEHAGKGEHAVGTAWRET